jgi:hypothetical protein
MHCISSQSARYLGDSGRSSSSRRASTKAEIKEYHTPMPIKVTEYHALIMPIHPSHVFQLFLPLSSNLSLGLECIGEALHVVGKFALVAEELDVGAVVLEAALGALSDVLFAAEGCEAPVLGDDDLLAAGELVLGSAEGFNGGGAVLGRISNLNNHGVDMGGKENLRASRVRTDKRIWPMLTRATRPLGLPKAPRIPV